MTKNETAILTNEIDKALSDFMALAETDMLSPAYQFAFKKLGFLCELRNKLLDC